jgi:hypothetical protein
VPRRTRSGSKAAASEAAFRSAKELREILDAVMREVDRDPAAGRLRSAAGPIRFDFPDLKLSLNISASDRGGSLRWDFTRRRSRPKLELRMESAFANRFLQGRENPAIAIARGRLRATVDDAGAALSFFGAAKPLFSRYREVIAERYPHLSID